MTPMPQSPFIPEEEAPRFVLDVDAFMAELDAPPVFLSDPSQAYVNMTADDLMPIVEILAGHLSQQHFNEASFHS